MHIHFAPQEQNVILKAGHFAYVFLKQKHTNKQKNQTETLKVTLKIHVAHEDVVFYP